MPALNLTQGPVAGSLFRLTAPMMVAVSSNILVSMLEIGFIGQLGTSHLAAITFTFPVVMILSSIALGIGIGTSSVIARSVRAGTTDEVKRLGTHSMVLVGVTMAILSLLGWLAIDPLFSALGAHTDHLPLIHSYLDIYYPSVVLFTLTMVAGNIMRANGSATIPGVVMTLGALLNLLLDPILIFGWFGLPRLELAAAALASAISRVCTVGVLVYYIVNGGLVNTRDIMDGFIRSARSILYIGLPAMATQLISPVSAAIVTRLLASHGEVVVAGFGVAVRIEAVAVMLLFALSGSIGPFVGQNWGARKPERVRDGMRAAYQFCMIWGLIAAVILFFTASFFASLVDDNDLVVRTAALYLTIVPWTYGLWGVLMMSSASFNALGKPLPSTALSFSRMFVIYIPIALLLDGMFGYHGIFIASAIGNSLTGVLGYLWFRKRYAASADSGAD